MSFYDNGKVIEEVVIEDSREQKRISRGLHNFSEEDKAKFIADTGLSSDELKNITIVEKRDSNVKLHVSFENTNTTAELNTNWFDLAKTEEGHERIYNANHFLGYRTDKEITVHRETVIARLVSTGQTGDVLSVNGQGLAAEWIKFITNGPANHTAILYVDDNGEKWVIEEKDPKSDLQKTKLSEWAERYIPENADIEMGRVNDVDSGLLKDAIQKYLFVANTENIKSLSYNTLNLIGLNGGDEGKFICSGLIEFIYKKADKDLFEIDQWQYSPRDIRNAIKEKGIIY